MNDKVENLVLEQLRMIREQLNRVENRMDTIATQVDDLQTGQQGQTGVLIALGRYIHDIDDRVGTLETKLGAQT